MKIEKEIFELIKSGRENEELEIKEDFTCLEKILKEIVALANTNGGKILIGWSEKVTGYNLEGIKQETLNLLKDEKLNDKVDKFLSKRVKFKIQIFNDFNKSKKSVGMIEVFPNDSYLIVFNKDFTTKENDKDVGIFRKGDIYVRHGSKTEKIDQQDLDEFLLIIKDVDYSDYKELVGLSTGELVDLYLLSPIDGQKKIIKNLFKILISFKEEWRYKSAGALGKIINKKDKDCLEKLIDIYNKSNIAEIKYKVLFIIKEVEFENIDSFLLDQLRLNDLELSGMAITAIGKTRNIKTWTKFLKFLDKLDLIELETRFANRVISAFNLIHNKKNIPYLIKLLKHHNEYVRGNTARILVRLCEEYKINQDYQNIYNLINIYIERNFKKIIRGIVENKKSHIKNVEKIDLYILNENNCRTDLLLVISLEVINKRLNRFEKSFFKKYIYSVDEEKKAVYLITEFNNKKIEFSNKIFIDFYSGFY
ncbi:MAG: RNA-binding domain-containing protein [Candidatus Humimicrobiaceae bacterium]